VTLHETTQPTESQQVQKLQLAKSATGVDVVRRALDAFGVANAKADDYALFVINEDHNGMKVLICVCFRMIACCCFVIYPVIKLCRNSQSSRF